MSDQVEVNVETDAPCAMPPAIAKSIIQVMGGVRDILKKNEADTGPGGKFKYASVDDVFEMIRPLMADAGIFLVMDQVKVDIFEKINTFKNETRSANWLDVKYKIWFYHSSGAGYGPINRQIQVQAKGPQNYGMTESYIEKYILRSMFMIGTGDPEVDSEPQEGLPVKNGSRIIRNEKISKESENNVIEYIKSCEDKWKEFKSSDELSNWWKETSEDRKVRFHSNDDPLYIELKEKVKAANAKFAQVKVKQVEGDAIPEFSGPPRPSCEQIRINLNAALAKSCSYQGCNEAYLETVEPYKDHLPRDFVNEMMNLTSKRGAMYSDEK